MTSQITAYRAKRYLGEFEVMLIHESGVAIVKLADNWAALEDGTYGDGEGNGAS